MIHPLILPEIEPLKIRKKDFINLQAECSTLEEIRKKAANNEIVQSRNGRQYRFEYRGEILVRRCVSSRDKQDIDRTVIVVPYECRKLTLKLAHDLPIAGHFSHRKTEIKVCAQFWWPGVSRDIRNYCKSCDKCQRTSIRGHTRKAPLMKMPIISTPFERIAIDIVGPLNPPSILGHKYIFTIIDYATSFFEALALREITSVNIAESLMTVFSRVGIPREVISDRGTQFTSDLMSEIHKLVGIKHIFTTPCHLMMNGKIERQHAVLKSILRKLCADKPRDWDRYLIPTLFAMREIPNDTSGYSPFELLYGRQVRGPLAILHELWSEPEIDKELRSSYEYVIELRDRLEDAAEHAALNTKIKTNTYKTYFDRKTTKRNFNVGDEVLLLLPDSNNKLLSSWRGPYKVVEVKSRINYLIDMNGKLKLFHINMLKSYIRRAKVNAMNLLDEVPTLEYFGINSAEVQNCIVLGDSDQEQGLVTLPDVEPKQELNINKNLNSNQKLDLEQVLNNYGEVLSDLPGCTQSIMHVIKIKTTETICKKNYPIPIHLKPYFDEEVDRMLEMDIITPSKSDFCSPSVMVEKRDTEKKTYRLTNDYRAVNSLTEFDAEPMPSIDLELHKFANCNFITEIDITRAYYQVPLSPESRKYTAFATSRGLMEYKRMPFGLVTACATYIRLMRKVMANLEIDEEKSISVYFDNIYIATSGWGSHLKLIDLVFKRLKDHGLTARPSKCFFAYPEVNYLGVRVGRGHITPNEDKVGSIRNLALPRTKKQLRSFLGLISFYRKFVPKMAELTAPLSDMLTKSVTEPLEWSSLSDKNFNTLKIFLCKPPILRLPDLEKTFCLRTDASNVGIGAVLCQYTGDLAGPVFYASRKLLSQEKNYSAIEKECLALVWSVDKFKYYLYGKEFIIETDHQPLTYLNTFKGSNSRLMRWALSLQPYQFTIVHVPGSINHGPDLLSRCLN